MEVNMAVFKGSAVAIVTPFKEADESVNYEAFADIIDYQINKTGIGCSYAERVSSRFGDDYMNKGIALAKEYRESVGYV